jgi:hypothetical protein
VVEDITWILIFIFQIGVNLKYSGYHCSWCTTPEGISVKLQSAIHQDFPRWGDYPEKLDIEYLTNLTQTGILLQFEYVYIKKFNFKDLYRFLKLYFAPIWICSNKNSILKVCTFSLMKTKYLLISKMYLSSYLWEL